MDIKSEIQKAAGKVGVDESAATLIADHLESEGLTIIKKEDLPDPAGGQKPVPSAQLRVQPAKVDTK